MKKMLALIVIISSLNCISSVPNPSQLMEVAQKFVCDSKYGADDRVATLDYLRREELEISGKWVNAFIFEKDEDFKVSFRNYRTQISILRSSLETAKLSGNDASYNANKKDFCATEF